MYRQVTTWLTRTALLAVGALLMWSVPAQAQSGSLTLSNDAEFSTSDRQFRTEHTLYARVTTTDLDVTTITENELKIEPNGKGERLTASFENHLDGTFTAAIPLSQLSGRTASWTVTATLEDDDDHEVETRARIVVHGLQDAPERFALQGNVTVVSESTIRVGEQRIQVNDSTKIVAAGRAIGSLQELEGKAATILVQRSDDGLVALRIVVRGAQAGSVELAGEVQQVGDTTFTLRNTRFVVDANTELEGKDGAEIALSDLQAGMTVEVEAERMNRFWLATEVEVVSNEDQSDEFTAEGSVESVGASHLVVSGLRIEVNSDTELDGIETLNALQEGTRVEVEYTANDEDTLVALSIEVADEDDDDGEREREIEVSGVITATTAQSISVNDMSFQVTSDTDIEGPGDDEALTIDDLFTGLQVEVKGHRSAEGAPVAEEIKIEEELETEVEVKGRIASIEDSTIQVGSTSFRVTAETTIEGEARETLTLGDLQEGLYVEAELTQHLDGTLTAERVKVEDRFEENEVEVAGQIEAVSSSSITVGDLTFSANADTEVEGKEDTSLRLADLTVGQVVEVKGHYEADSSLVADRVKVEERVHAEAEIEGALTALSDSSLTVAGVSFRVAAQTTLDDIAALSALQVGSRVEVDFRALSGLGRLALEIETSDDDDEPVELKGTVDSTSTEALFVAGIQVGVSSETRLRGPRGQQITLADISSGARVEVEAQQTSDGALVAQEVSVKHASKLAGNVQARKDSTVRVAGRTIQLTSETRVYGRNNAALRLEDVEANAFVEVLAVSETSASSSSSRQSTAPAGKYAAGSESTTLTAERVQVKQSSTTIDTERPGRRASGLVLEQNYPNPFAEQTTIRFALDDPKRVTLTVFNLLGQKVRTLVQAESLDATSHEVTWNGRDESGQPVASGVYLYRLQAGDQVRTQRMVLVR